MTSTLIKNGKVYAHDKHEFVAADVRINDGVIQKIGKTSSDADNVVDATGLYVAPGFIDMHCHIFNHPLFKNSRLNADRIGVNQGVACLIDTGSAGPTSIDAFEEFVINTQATRSFALCNIGSPGLPGIDGGHAAKPELISLSGTVEAIERHPEWILGV